MAHKYPLTKPMLLIKSDVDVVEKNITVRMHIKGADFLRAKKTDKELVKVLKNLFGIEYTIELVEELSKEDMMAIKKKLENEEKEIIHNIEEKNREFQAQNQANEVPEYHDVDYKMPEDIDGYIPQEGVMPEDVTYEEPQEYIMGKPSKAKEKHMNIKDITANDGRVTLEGRILTSEVRQTKSGKGMLIFDLYDGTGTITVKSFAKDLREGEQMIEKIQNAKSIKTIGKAGLDTYAGDVTVIANTIIETNKEIAEPEEVEEEETPLNIRRFTKYNRTISKSRRFRCR